MENYDRTMELVETAQNSAGKADIQFGKYTDTLTYKINSLQGSLEALRQNFLDSDFLKKAIDLVGKLVDKLSQLNFKEMAIEIGLIATVGKSSFSTLMKAMSDSLAQLNASRKGAREQTVEAVGSGVRDAKIVKDVREKVKQSQLKRQFRNRTLSNIEITSVPETPAKVQTSYTTSYMDKEKGIVQAQFDSAADAIEFFTEKAKQAAQSLVEIPNEFQTNQEQQEDAFQILNERAKTGKLTKSQIDNLDYIKAQIAEQIEEGTSYVYGEGGALIADTTGKALQQVGVEFQAFEDNLSTIDKQVGSIITQIETDSQEYKAAMEQVEKATKEAAKDAEYSTVSEVGANIAVAPKETSKLGKYVKSQLKPMGNAIATGIAPTITNGIMLGIAGADFKTIGATMVGTLTSFMLPQIISSFIAPLITAAGPIGLAVAGVAALTAGLVIYSEKLNKANKEAEQAELDRLKKVANANKTLAEEQTNLVGENKSSRTSQQKLLDDIETYNKYHGQAFLTDKNQEELTKAIEDLNSNFSDVISYYDEQTQTLDINTDAVNNLTAEMEKTRLENQSKIAFAGGVEQENLAFQSKKTQEVLERLSNMGYLKTTGNMVYPFGEDEIAHIGLTAGTAGIYNILSPLFSHSIYEGRDGYNYTDYGRNTLDTSLEAVQNDILEQFTDLEDDVQSEIFTKLLAATGEQITSYNQLKDAIETGTISLTDFSDVIDTISYSNEQDQRKIWRETAKQYYQAMSSDDLQIDDYLAEALAKLASYDTAKEISREFSLSYGEMEAAGIGNDREKITTLLSRPNASDMLSDLDVSKAQLENEKTNWSSLSTAFQNAVKTALDNTDFDSSDWKELKENQEEYYSMLQKVMYAQSQTFALQQQSQDFEKAIQDERVQDLITQLNTLREEQSSLTSDEYSKKFNSIVSDLVKTGIIGTQEMANAFKGQEQQSDESFTNINKKAQETLSAIFTGEDYSFDNLSLGVKQAIIDSFEGQEFSKNQREAIARIFVEQLSSLPADIQNEMASALSQIDLTKGYGELYSQATEFSEQMEELGIPTKTAYDTYVSYIREGTEQITNVLTGKLGLEQAYNQFAENLKTSLENSKDLLSAIASYGKGDTLTGDEAATLVAAGANYNKAGELQFDQKEVSKQLLEDLTGSLYDVAKQMGDTIRLGNVSGQLSKSEQSQIESIMGLGLGGSELTKKIDELGLSDNMEQILYAMTSMGVKTIEEFQEKAKEVADNSDQTLRNMVGTTRAALTEEFGDAEELEKAYEKAKRSRIKAEKDLAKAERDAKKARKDLEKANKDLEKSERKLIEAQEDLTKAQKEQYEAYYGTPFYDSSLDDLYNYTQAIDSLNNQLERTEELFNEIGSTNDAAQTWQTYTQQTESLVEEQQALIDTYQRLADEGSQFLTQKYGQYFSIGSNGKLLPDISFIEDALIPDDEKKYIEESISQINDYVDQREDLLKQNYEISKQYKEKVQQLYKDYVSLESNIADVLKKQAEEEVNTTKDKYDKLKEADDDYLDALEDAINRQRKLRDTENAYEELAQKQKKLSLLQRDTSGANRVAALELEKDIQDTQQDLLDESVDNIIDNMKSLQETQQELRDADIELEEAVIDNTNWNKEAAAILKTFKTIEDYQGWMAANDVDYKDMSVDQQAVQMMEWQTQGQTLVNYLGSQAQGITEEIQTSAENVSNIITSTYEAATGALERDYQSMQYNVGESQKEADKSVQDAVDSLQDARDAVEDAKEAIIDAQDAIVDADLNLADAKDSLADAKKAEAEALAQWQISQQFVEDSMNNLYSDLVDHVNDLGKAVSNLPNYTGNKSTSASQTIATEEKSKATLKSSSQSTFKTSQTSIAQEEMSKAALKQSIKNSFTSSNDVIVDTAKRSEYKNYPYALNLGNGKFAYAKTKQAAENWITNQRAQGNYKQSVDLLQLINNNSNWTDEPLRRGEFGPAGYKFKKRYATGGYVDYTGPAWVDGTKTKPEAFLSADDTENVRKMIDLMGILLSGISTSQINQAYNSTNTNNNQPTNVEVVVNVDSISDDYSVDEAVERVKKDIVSAYNQVGKTVILKK